MAAIWCLTLAAHRQTSFLCALRWKCLYVCLYVGLQLLDLSWYCPSIVPTATDYSLCMRYSSKLYQYFPFTVQLWRYADCLNGIGSYATVCVCVFVCCLSNRPVWIVQLQINLRAASLLIILRILDTQPHMPFTVIVVMCAHTKSCKCEH